MVKLLLERDDVDAESKDKYGKTPLLGAAINGHETIVKLLIDRDDVAAGSKDSDDQTPLWAAETEGHEAVMKLLWAKLPSIIEQRQDLHTAHPRYSNGSCRTLSVVSVLPTAWKPGFGSMIHSCSKKSVLKMHINGPLLSAVVSLKVRRMSYKLYA